MLAFKLFVIGSILNQNGSCGLSIAEVRRRQQTQPAFLMNAGLGRTVPSSDQIGGPQVGGRLSLTASGCVNGASPRKPVSFFRHHFSGSGRWSNTVNGFTSCQQRLGFAGRLAGNRNHATVKNLGCFALSKRAPLTLRTA
jgi:hypothetical protein